MDAGLIYANARIKALENNLINTDKMLRMIDSSSLDEAVKVLIENNYGGGIVLDNPSRFENLLSEEIKVTTDSIREMIPKNLGMEVFFIRLDYHNAKAYMKAKYLGLENADEMLDNPGLIDIDKMAECIKTDSYNDLYPEMKKALEAIDTAFVSGYRSPRLIDINLDKAFFKHAKTVASNGAKSINKYITALADVANISSFLRCRKAKMEYKYFEQGFVEGGDLSESFFEPLYEQSEELVNEKFRYTSYKELLEKVVDNENNALVDFETAVDNYLLNIFKGEKHDLFSIAPLAGYYLAKTTEIKVARMILVCIKNKVDKLLIKQRLRELYA